MFSGALACNVLPYSCANRMNVGRYSIIQRLKSWLLSG